MHPIKKTLNLKCPPKRILVISMRYLGDLLLATPLIHSIRRAFPEARLDLLVFANASAILEGNPDVDRVITTPVRPSKTEFFQLCKILFRNYDLAVATETGDRRFIYALLAAPQRVAFSPPKNSKGWWKRYLVQAWMEYDEQNTHTVRSMLQLSGLLHLTPCYSLIPPRCASAATIRQSFHLPTDYVVMHIHPQWIYKRWTVQGWIETAQYLHEQGLKIVLTGSSAAEERKYIDAIQRHLPGDTVNLTGRTSLAQLTPIIEKACLYIGPDTGITHLAAATGTTVIAIYGPTNPAKWGPWPFGYKQDTNPFRKTGNQHVGNIYLVQGKADCVPCQQEGCDRHRGSRSKCLDTLTAAEVIEVIQHALKQPKNRIRT